MTVPAPTPPEQREQEIRDVWLRDVLSGEAIRYLLPKLDAARAEVTRLTAELEQVKSEAWENLLNCERDALAETERLAARCALLENALREIADYLPLSQRARAFEACQETARAALAASEQEET